MTKNITHFRRALLAAGVLLATQSSFADTLKFNGFADGSVDVNITSIPAAIVTHDQVGAYATSVNGGASFDTFCVDVWQFLNFSHSYSLGTGNDYQYKSTSALTGYVTDGGAGATLTLTVLNDLSSLYNEVESTGGYAGNNVKSAALQVAIWEVAYDTVGGYNLSSGNFYSPPTLAAPDPSVITQAGIWLTGLGAYSNTAYSVFGYTSGSYQDVIGFTPTSPVPEPETYAMLLAGLGLMGFVARRRKQDDAA